MCGLNLLKYIWNIKAVLENGTVHMLVSQPVQESKSSLLSL